MRQILFQIVCGFTLFFAASAFAETAQPKLGITNAASGGFPADLWSKSDGKQVEKLLGLLPETVFSPATHDLVRRALLTSAPAPVGLSETAFLQDRAVALLKIGDASEAAALLHSTAANSIDAAVARQIVDGAFWAADTETACLDVRGYVTQYSDPYWKRALIVCELAVDQRDQAGRDLAAISAEDDPDFHNLAQAVIDSSQPAVTSRHPTALDVALLRIARARLPNNLITSEDVVILKGVSRTETMPASTRVETGYEAAAQSGLGIGEMLALLRLSGAETPAASGETIGRDDPTQSMASAAHRDAGLVQDTERSKDSAERVRLLRKLLTTDAENADIPLLARVELVRILPISSDRTLLAPAAARGFFLEGDTETAARWYDIARKTKGEEFDRLWPLAHIAFDDVNAPGSAAGLQRWVTQTLANDKENGPKTVERVLAAVSALGEPVPASLWAASLSKPDDDSSVMGSMAISAVLAEAAQKGARGDVILLIALSLKDGPGHAHPLNLNHSISALRNVGLENPAKAIALEGLAPATMLPPS